MERIAINGFTRNGSSGGVARSAPVVAVPAKKTPPPVAYRLETLRAWLKDLGVVYRAARKGHIPLEDLSRYAYAANIGASKAYQLEMIEKIEAMHARLDAMEGRTDTPTYAGLDPAIEDMARSMEPTP
jgi:hypothetical protein